MNEGPAGGGVVKALAPIWPTAAPVPDLWLKICRASVLVCPKSLEKDRGEGIVACLSTGGAVGGISHSQSLSLSLQLYTL